MTLSPMEWSLAANRIADFCRLQRFNDLPAGVQERVNEIATAQGSEVGIAIKLTLESVLALAGDVPQVKQVVIDSMMGLYQLRNHTFRHAECYHSETGIVGQPAKRILAQQQNKDFAGHFALVSHCALENSTHIDAHHRVIDMILLVLSLIFAEDAAQAREEAERAKLETLTQ